MRMYWHTDRTSHLAYFRTALLAGVAIAIGVTTGVATSASQAETAETAKAQLPGAVAFGFNGNGELGNGGITSSGAPVAVNQLSEAAAISAGGYHNLALLDNGTVSAWGYNGYGELGDGTDITSLTPVEVRDLHGVTAVSAGEFHSLALLSSGNVVAWGGNNDGQLGNGSIANSDVPVAVGGLSGVTAISAGGCGRFPEGHSLALLSNGRVMAWGDNDYGQLGDGNTANSDVPVEVSGLKEVVAISAGEFFSLALLKNGTVLAWGRNDLGQLGDAGTQNSDVPVAVQQLSGATAISAGSCGGSPEGHSLALLGNGTVKSWGYNAFGELGDGNATNSDVPVEVSGLTGVTAISAGGSHSLALRNNGTIAAWGGNYSGQLGTDSPTGSDVPVEIAGLSAAKSISAGAFHSLALIGVPAAPPSPPVPPTPPTPPTPPAPPTGTQSNVIIGLSDGSGWGPEDSRRFLQGGITSERLAAGGPSTTIAESLANGWRNDTVLVGNTPDGQPLSTVNIPEWTARALAEVKEEAAHGVTLLEVGNEMVLKGTKVNANGETIHQSEPAKYAEMFMSLATAVDAAGIKGVKLLFSSDGDYQRPDKTWSQMCCGGGWVADALKAEPELLTRVDGFISHPYGRAHTDTSEHGGPGGMEDQHANVVALGFEHTDYYLTEYGVQWTPGQEGPINAPTQALQAAWIKEAYEEFVALPYVRGIWYYQSHDDSTGAWGLIEPQLNGLSPFIPREALGVVEEFAKAEN
jgi:alpha-tubulin suppressor-like RCC1 family protein